MRSPEPSPAEQLRFLENYQTLLDEGQFTATYKFALLVALADLAVESGDTVSNSRGGREGNIPLDGYRPSVKT
ncbi:MAG TPA: hypothetical protein VF139_16400 [Candidatus Polarisedimenticolaceae bacterium]